MTSESRYPWTTIHKPSSGFSVLRVDSNHPQDFFWGKDTLGCFLLILVVDERHKEYLEKRTLELQGVKTDIRFNQFSGEHYFILSLQNAENADIFHRLCIDLIDCTKTVQVQKTAFEIIYARLKRWKIFLSKKGSHLLTAQEVQGLYAELVFLHECISRHAEQTATIAGWQGPLDGPHDFVLGDHAVEVKSVSGTHKNVVRISSENQLVTHLDRLYLQVYFLAEFHDGREGISLNQMVEKVRNEIDDADNKDVFENRLYETRYIELKDYDRPCYKVTQQKTFEVKEGFPRITPENLTQGLANVSYDLALRSLEEYVCDPPYEKG